MSRAKPMTADRREASYRNTTAYNTPRQWRRYQHKLNHALALTTRPAPQMIHSEPAQKADAARLSSLTAGIQRAFGLAAQSAPDDRAAGRKLWRHRNRSGKR